MEFIRTSSLPAAAAGVSIAIVVAAIIMQRKSKYMYPPGPSRLSAIVTMLFYPEDFLNYQKTWRRLFGKIYTLVLGQNKHLVMTDYDLIHNTFVAQADYTSSRPTTLGQALLAIEGKGIGMSPDWKEQRRFALAVLREQGMGKMDMEAKILEEVDPFMKQLESYSGAPAQIDSLMHKAVSNIICNLVFGSRFDYKDAVFNDFLENFFYLFRLSRKMSVIHDLPFLKWLPGDPFDYHARNRRLAAFREFMMSAIRQHAQALDLENPKDFIDSYLIEIQQREKSGQKSSFDEINCLASVINLFVAGTDTTANTLMWCWLYMIIYPEVQDHVYREISARMGSRVPSLQDRVHMPYTEAVLTEVMRLSSVAPATIPHKTDRDINIGGYFIPKDTSLSASIYDVHLNEETYPSPEDFSPGRFLAPDGTFMKPKKFIPFGIGRRACVGESLARAELFLFLTSVLQQFRIEGPAGCVIKAEGKLKPVHKPLPYFAVFKRRTMTVE